MSLCTVYDSVLFTIDEVSQPTLLRMCFKDWLTYSVSADRSGELCYNFCNSNDLTQMVNFPTWISDSDSHSSALLDLFISSDASIYSAMGFPPLGKSDHVVV